MGFYDFSRILRGIIYGVKGITKYLCYSLLIVAFIVVCLLLMSNKSNAVSDLQKEKAIEFFENSGYDSYFLLNGGTLILFDNIDGNQFYTLGYSATNEAGNYWLSCSYTSSITTYSYTVASDGSISYLGNNLKFGRGNNCIYIRYDNVVSGNYDITSRYDGSIYFIADYIVPVFISPSLLPPASEEQSQQEALTSGQFTYFVVEPGSIPKNQDILMDVYNTTNSDSASVIAHRYELNQNSIFLIESETYKSGYAYFLTARFLDWFQVVNGNSYKVRLSWVNPNNPLQTDSVEYSWTMSLTAEQQTTEEQKTQQEINQGINNLNNSINDLNNTQQETNDFLKDDSYDENDIVLPSIEIDTEMSEYGSELFAVIMSAFTSDNYIDFEFTIPFSNEKIAIPSNYIENHLPSVVINIIRVFYWYFISRYIIKDILRIVDNMRQGDWFLKGESNIKTEVL